MSKPSTLAVLALAATAAALFAFTRPAAVAHPAAGWEYQIVRGGIDIAASPQVQQEQIAGTQGTLNQLGGEGWELAAIHGQFAVMKRPR
jgi:hypothetical protein